MDNPLKKHLLARLCTRDLKKHLCVLVVQDGQEKTGLWAREEQVDLAVKQAWLSFKQPSGTMKEEISRAVDEIVKGGGIGKECRKETGQWSVRIGKGDVE